MLGALLGDAWALSWTIVERLHHRNVCAGRRQMLGTERAPAIGIAHILQALP